MIEAMNVSSACNLSLGVILSWRRICERSTPLESISGIGNVMLDASGDSLNRSFTR
jgi:hypothetical protein